MKANAVSILTATALPKVMTTIGSESNARSAFRDGRLPVEFMIDGKRPGISAQTAARIDAERAAARKAGGAAR